MSRPFPYIIGAQLFLQIGLGFTTIGFWAGAFLGMALNQTLWAIHAAINDRKP